MRCCSKCKIEKELSEFNNKKASPDGLNYQCKECEKQYTRNHYKNNKQYYKAKARKNDILIRNWFIEYKSKLCCEKCGETHPSTFDFHHIDPSKKEYCISVLLGNGSLTNLQEEIKKCMVLCANCHRKFHAGEAQMDEQAATNRKDG